MTRAQRLRRIRGYHRGRRLRFGWWTGNITYLGTTTVGFSPEGDPMIRRTGPLTGWS